MASTFTARLRYEKQADGENSNTWGGLVNTVFDLIDEARAGYLSKSVAGSSDVTLTANNSATDENRQAILEFTGAITADISVIVSTVENWWMIKNSTTGAFSVTVKTSAGIGIEVPKNVWTFLYCDGTNVLEVKSYVGETAIINGNFDLWQRGTSFTAPANNDYGPDRFKWSFVGVGVVDMLRSTSVPDNKSDFSFQIDVTTADATIVAGDLYAIRYLVEGYDAMRFGFGTADATQLTLSFWVRSAKTGIHCVAFANSANNRSYVIEYTINAADTWEYKTVTLTADITGTWLTDSNIGLQLRWTLAAGTDFQGTANTWNAADDYATSNQVNAMDNAANNFHIARIKLEVGDTATAFNRRPFTQELSLALYYYEELGRSVVTDEEFMVLQASSTSVTNGALHFYHKRAVPSVSFSAASDFQVTTAAGAGEVCSALTAASPTNDFVRLTATKTTADLVAGNAVRLIGLNTNAHIKIDAEL